MVDEKIIELYWKRDETAIQETAQKYEKYLIKIAYNILNDTEDSAKVLMIHILRRGTVCRLINRQCLKHILVKSQGRFQ